MVQNSAHGMSEDDLLRQTAEERDKIFQRYEHGRKEGATIDAWEDPTFEVYHSTDRYGFIHDRRLPAKLVPHEVKVVELELKRQKKWLKMLRTWSAQASMRHDPKLRGRIYKGVPNSVRSQVWCLLLDVHKLRAENPDRYVDMLKLARNYSKDARQIDCDVNRQFRDHMHYRERYSIKQRSLFNVLTAYAIYNSEVGYCQGMSTVAGMLLMYMDEEDAFWALHILLTCPQYAMHGLYKYGFPKLQRLLVHFDNMLLRFLPKLKRHLDRNGVDTILYSLKWFFVCFVERIPFQLCLRIWDIYLLDGEFVILAMAFTILKLHQRSILKLKDMDAIVHYIQISLHEDFRFDDEYVIESLQKYMSELKRAKLHQAGTPGSDELPSQPFGVFKQSASVYEVIGDKKQVEQNEQILNKTDVEALLSNESDELIEKVKQSQLTIRNYVHLTESKLSLDDGTSSILEEEHTSSRRSLAETSVTSTADLSLFSGHTPLPVSEASSSMSDQMKATSSSSSSSREDSDKMRSSRSSGAADVLRIYVPYSPLHTPVVSPQNGDVVRHSSFDTLKSASPPGPPPPPSPLFYIPDSNRILIKVDNDEQLTPLVQQPSEHFGTIVNHREYH